MILDRLGRKQPENLGWRILLQAIPGLAGQFRQVPDAYLERDGAVTVVRCPCGEEPELELNQAARCGCERLYLHAGDVFVANSPKRDT